MQRASRWASLVLALFFPWVAQAQQLSTAAVESAAPAALQESIAAAGATGVNAVAASGTMTYFWAGQPVAAPATILARGRDDFLLQVDLAEGRQLIAMTARSGARKWGGKISEIPVHNRITSGGNPVFPYTTLVSAMSDRAGWAITDLGLVERGGRKLRDIRLQRKFSGEQDPLGLLSSLSVVDYLIDPASALIVRTESRTHPLNNLAESYPRELELEGYTQFGGVMAPTLIR